MIYFKVSKSDFVQLLISLCFKGIVPCLHFKHLLGIMWRNVYGDLKDMNYISRVKNNTLLNLVPSVSHLTAPWSELQGTVR